MLPVLNTHNTELSASEDVSRTPHLYMLKNIYMYRVLVDALENFTGLKTWSGNVSLARWPPFCNFSKSILFSVRIEHYDVKNNTYSQINYCFHV